MSSVLRKSKACNIAPTDMTKQGLLDALISCGRANFDENGRPFDYHFMAICISELSNFMSEYDSALAGLLTDLFDCPPMNEEKKRSGAGKAIPFPGLSFIMGTATGNLGKTISKDMWDSGFMARVIMVFSAEEVVPEDMFAENKQDEALAEELAITLAHIGELKGAMAWTPEAQLSLRDFRTNQKHGAPIHNRLTHYVTRRWLHLAKLCMIAALARVDMVVTIDDYLTAMAWLLDAESEMTEIFKDMVSHEDGQIFQELRMQVWQQHMRTRNPVTAQWVYQFLSQRSGSYGVARMVEIAEAAGYLDRLAGTSGLDALYVPGKTLGPMPGVL